MPEIALLNKENKPVGKIDMPQDIFSAEVRKDILHEVVQNYLANQRQGTASTKTKGLVSGGGKKPWKQKGTGRARAGSNRSPIWRGGGIVFGPQPRAYSYKLPKKVRWIALNSALSAKFSDKEVTVVEDLSMPEPKTKRIISILNSLGLTGSILIVIPEKDRTLELAARNIPDVKLERVEELNPYVILSYSRLLLTKGAVEKMMEIYIG
ncbi:MAG TPA: 50S ribosomal protein L4 [Nitrospiraceae bacterium]|nr:50S ribosomal protein L4 [Nitrospiraceae bacterium]